MKILKVLAACKRCGFEWWTRGKRREPCPACGRLNITGWTIFTEKREIARIGR